LKIIKRLLPFPFRFQRIRSRFLFAMIMISIPSLFILGFISFNIAKDTLMKTNTQTNQEHLETSSEVADLLFRNIINLNRAIVWNDQILYDLRASNSIQNEYELIAIKSELVAQMQRIVNNNFIDSRYIDSICLYNLNYKPNCLGRSDDAGMYESSLDRASDIERSSWYQESAEANGRVVFFTENVLGDSDRSFSTVKLFRDSDQIQGEQLGLVIVNISKSIFDSIFTSNQNGGEYVALDASQDQLKIIFPEHPSSLALQTNRNLKETYESLRNNGYLISEYRNQTTGWHFIYLIELSKLLEESNKIGKVTAIIASAMAILALSLSYFITGSITRPLLQLKKMMVDWMKGSRSFTQTFAQDEVGEIGETFKRMVHDNMELNEKLVHTELKEREAELRALQAQIKPHFLYNTLDSIYWMATLQNNHDVAQMAVSLSESFKLSLNKGNDTIPVYKELKHIEHYLTIQNIRYNHRFKYIEEVDPSIKGVEILKLILQPLIENAIYHGLEQKVGDGVVRLTGRRDGDYLEFVVEDDGIGIQDMSLTEQGYGLRNVRERLELYYGPTNSIRIVSEVNKGTSVTVRFMPKIQEVNSDA
jgi:two-component system sensor histidine kinase YesM